MMEYRIWTECSKCELQIVAAVSVANEQTVDRMMELHWRHAHDLEGERDGLVEEVLGQD